MEACSTLVNHQIKNYFYVSSGRVQFKSPQFASQLFLQQKMVGGSNWGMFSLSIATSIQSFCSWHDSQPVGTVNIQHLK